MDGKPKLLDQVRAAIRLRHLSYSTEKTYVHWIKQYGNKLLNVRYYDDLYNKRKLKTCEIIVEEKSWKDQPSYISPKRNVKLKIEYGEIDLGIQIKKHGGRWNKAEKVWELPYKIVANLGLTERIEWNKM